MVGPFKEYTRMTDVEFAVPSKSPARIKKNCTLYDDERPAYGKTWADMADHVEGYMRSFQAQQTAEREEYMI